MTVRVTDHAVLCYLERVMGLDVESLRSIIADGVERHSGAPCVRALGARFLLRDGRVVTALADRTVPSFDILARLSKENRR